MLSLLLDECTRDDENLLIPFGMTEGIVGPRPRGVPYVLSKKE